MLDPLETLTYVAANTNKIALGTCVIDMLFHNPVILALMFYQKEGLFTNWLYEHPNLTRVGPDPDGR